MIRDLSDMGTETKEAYRKWMKAAGISMMIMDAAKKAISMETDLLNEFQSFRLPELKSMPYKEYLQTPEWQQVRKRSLMLADNKCQVCEASGVELHVHHKTYERRGEELPDDLIVLCKTCHEDIHKKDTP